MCKRLFTLLAFAFTLFGTQCWATPTTCGGEGQPPCSITNTFSPGTTVGVYTFGDSTLRVEFVGGVKRTFSLTVTEVTLTDAQLAARLDPNVFPTGTTCFHYGGGCEEYAFTGNAGGPNGVPVKNVDYGPPIRLTLTYFSGDPAKDPAFGHAPGDTTTFSEDILVGYFKPFEDDTMDGSTPSLSSVIALNQPLEQNDTFCLVSPQQGQTIKIGEEIQVAFRLFPSGPCTGNPGTALRDKDARVSLIKFVNGQPVFQRVRSEEGGNRFHFDHEDGVNERDLSTEGLTPGDYAITIFSDEFPPQTVTFTLIPGDDEH